MHFQKLNVCLPIQYFHRIYNDKKLITCGVILLSSLTFTLSCNSLTTRDSLKNARTKIESGKGGDLAPKIAERYETIAPDAKQDAVLAVAADETQKGSAALREIYRKSKNDDLKTRQRIVRELAKRKQDKESQKIIRDLIRSEPDLLLQQESAEFAPTVLGMVREDPSLMSESVIDYFTKHAYTQAVPDLIMNAESGTPLSEKSLTSLSNFPSDQASDYLIATASNTNSPLRTSALNLIPSLKDETAKKKGVEYIKNTLRQEHPLEADKLIPVIEVSGKIKNDPELIQISKNLYRSTNNREIQNKLLAALESMTDGRDPNLKKSLMVVAQTEKQNEVKSTPPLPSKEEKQTRPAKKEKKEKSKSPATNKVQANVKPEKKRETTPKKPKVVEEKKRKEPEPKIEKNTPKDSVARGRFKYANELAKYMGDEEANVMLLQIHNAFLSYSSSDSASASYIVRSIQRESSLSHAQIKTKLALGMREPSSLGYVVRGVKKDYKTFDLRSYALSELFGLTRFQANTLLELSDKGKF